MSKGRWIAHSFSPATAIRMGIGDYLFGWLYTHSMIPAHFDYRSGLGQGWVSSAQPIAANNDAVPRDNKQLHKREVTSLSKGGQLWDWNHGMVLRVTRMRAEVVAHPPVIEDGGVSR